MGNVIEKLGCQLQTVLSSGTSLYEHETVSCILFFLKSIYSSYMLGVLLIWAEMKHHILSGKFKLTVANCCSTRKHSYQEQPALPLSVMHMLKLHSVQMSCVEERYYKIRKVCFSVLYLISEEQFAYLIRNIIRCDLWVYIREFLALSSFSILINQTCRRLMPQSAVPGGYLY